MARRSFKFAVVEIEHLLETKPSTVASNQGLLHPPERVNQDTDTMPRTNDGMARLCRNSRRIKPWRGGGNIWGISSMHANSVQVEMARGDNEGGKIGKKYDRNNYELRFRNGRNPDPMVGIGRGLRRVTREENSNAGGLFPINELGTAVSIKKLNSHRASGTGTGVTDKNSGSVPVNNGTHRGKAEQNRGCAIAVLWQQPGVGM